MCGSGVVTDGERDLWLARRLAFNGGVAGLRPRRSAPLILSDLAAFLERDAKSRKPGKGAWLLILSLRKRTTGGASGCGASRRLVES